MTSVLEFSQVTVTRGTQNLIHNINWTVNDGERWVILGPNGAGKSTLLSIAGARLHPTRGTVDILDEILGAVDVFELRPRIGLTSAAIAHTIPEHEKVQDVIVTAAYGISGRWNEEYDGFDTERANELLAAWGIQDLAQRTFGSLSDGEKKRTLIARALMTDPELLLLDEPAAGMDIAGREDLVTRLTDLAQDTTAPAIVLISHHLEEIPPGFTHALLLRNGEAVASGPIPETITAENLEKTYGMAFDLSSTPHGRFTAFARNAQ